MIILPQSDENNFDSDASGSLLTGVPAPLPLGTFRLPDDPHLLAPATPDDDPVAKADAMRERAGQVFHRHRAIGAFNRALDELFANIAEGTHWSEGLSKFDQEIGNLRQKHGAVLHSAEDRAAFTRHADEFAAMQRISLKRALVERQHADALSQLDDQLAYYAAKAVAAPNHVFREIAIDAGLRSIEEIRDAGYLFPETAEKVETRFLTRVEEADDVPPPLHPADQALKEWIDDNVENNVINPPHAKTDPGINVGIPSAPRDPNPGVPKGQANPPAPRKSQDI